MSAVEVAGDRLEVGDSCFVRADGDPLNRKPFVARIQRISPDTLNGGQDVLVQWYYRPEDPGIPGGRRAFHGERELYMSDHTDHIHSATILGRCVVHTLDNYRDLELIRPQDYYSRFHFSVRTKRFGPETVTVYCTCQMPENPDCPMCQCDGCSEWLHPECCGTTLQAVEALPQWFCPNCLRKRAASYSSGSGSAGAPPAQQQGSTAWLLGSAAAGGAAEGQLPSVQLDATAATAAAGMAGGGHGSGAAGGGTQQAWSREPLPLSGAGGQPAQAAVPDALLGALRAQLAQQQPAPLGQPPPLPQHGNPQLPYGAMPGGWTW